MPIAVPHITLQVPSGLHSLNKSERDSEEEENHCLGMTFTFVETQHVMASPFYGRLKEGYTGSYVAPERMHKPCSLPFFFAHKLNPLITCRTQSPPDTFHAFHKSHLHRLDIRFSGATANPMTEVFVVLVRTIQSKPTARLTHSAPALLDSALRATKPARPVHIVLESWLLIVYFLVR